MPLRHSRYGRAVVGAGVFGAPDAQVKEPGSRWKDDPDMPDSWVLAVEFGTFSG